MYLRPSCIQPTIWALQSRDRVIQRKSTKSDMVCFVRFRPMWKVWIQKKVRYCTSKIEKVWTDYITNNGSVNGISWRLFTLTLRVNMPIFGHTPIIRSLSHWLIVCFLMLTFTKFQWRFIQKLYCWCTLKRIIDGLNIFLYPRTGWRNVWATPWKALKSV